MYYHGTGTLATIECAGYTSKYALRVAFRTKSLPNSSLRFPFRFANSLSLQSHHTTVTLTMPEDIIFPFPKTILKFPRGLFFWTQLYTTIKDFSCLF